MAYTTEKIENMMKKLHQGEKISKIFYQNNIGFRTNGIQFCLTNSEIEKYAKCYNDIVYFAENFCDIKLRDYQKKMIELYKENKQIIYCSSRQVGLSTILQIIMLHELVFGQSKEIAIMNNKRMNSVEMLEGVMLKYSKLPFYIKPGVISKNSTCFQLENMNRIKIINNNIQGLRRNVFPLTNLF